MIFNFKFYSVLNRKIEIFLYSLFGFLFSFVVLSGSYTIGDGYWTPLRFLGKARSLFSGSDTLNVHFIGDIYSYVVHNDSVKLFPSLAELPVYSFYGYWEPRASVFIGVLFYLFLIFVFSRIVQKEKYLSIGSFSIILILTSLLIPSHSALVRFTSVFSSHRTIPAICLVSSSLLLFKGKRQILLPYKDIILLSFLSVVATFSFANGFILPLLTLFSLCRKLTKRDTILHARRILAFLIPVIVASIFYFKTLSLDHHVELSARHATNLGIGNIFSGLIYSVKFLTYWDYSAFSLILMIVLLPAPLALLMRRIRRPNHSRLDSNIAFDDQISLSRLSFVLCFYLLTIPIVIVLRGSPNVPDRYFVEATLASASFYMIVLLLNKRTAVKKIALVVILLITVTKISYTSFDALSGRSFNSGESVDEVIVECIRNHQYQDYNYLESQCGISRGFWHFAEESLTSHPSIKIDDPEKYSEVLFNTLNKNSR